MSNYLVVANQTLGRRELRDRLAAIAAHDVEAAFTVLVPATDASHLLVWEPGEAHEIAQHRAEEAQRVLTAAGLRVTRASVGDASPVHAIEAELQGHPGEYAAALLCTLPPGVSRWLGLNVLDEAEERLGLPIEHIVAGDVYEEVLEQVEDEELHPSSPEA